MPSPICLLRTLWRSLLCGAWVAGHDYETAAEKTPPNVHILVCRTCGAQSVAWDWTSVEHSK